MYQKCPKSWELAYGRGLRSKEPNINLLFGNAVHGTIQEWLIKQFAGESGFDLVGNFKMQMLKYFESGIASWGQPFSNPDELFEYYNDGIEILKFLDARFEEVFNPSQYDLLGFELPIDLVPIEERPSVRFKGYLDLVFRDKVDGSILIKDIKTSKSGWNEYAMYDISKISQLLLYKYYYSNANAIELDNVVVEFFILKRKTTHPSEDRIQLYIPPQGIELVAKTVAKFEEFVFEAFTPEGLPNLDIEYDAVAGKNYTNCRFCDFAKNEDLCPVNKRG